MNCNNCLSVARQMETQRMKTEINDPELTQKLDVTINDVTKTNKQIRRITLPLEPTKQIK